MKPNFSLSLSFDGIRLLFRDASGWTEIGDVSLEADDLAAELSTLRRAAQERAPDGIRSKVVIPEEQIKYLTLPGRGLSDADVRAALEGATPYSVDELTYDFAQGPDGTCVAAVANETLDEAESFAVEHAFGPVCFVAAPGNGSFPREPFFGKTRAAGDAPVTRDEAPAPSDKGAATEPDEGSAPAPEEPVARGDDEPPAGPAEPTPAEAPPAEAPPVEAPPVEEISLAGVEGTPPAEAAPEPTAEAPDVAADSPPPVTEASGEHSEERPSDPPEAELPADDETSADDPAAPEPRDDPAAALVTEDAPQTDAGAPGSAPDENPEDPPRPVPAEPVFTSRLRSLRAELGEAPLPPVPPMTSRPVPAAPAPPSTPALSTPALSNPDQPLAAAGREPGASVPDSATPMPPALARALQKAGNREAVPPRGGASGPAGRANGPVVRPSVPPPAVSKELRKLRSGPDFTQLNGSGPVRPIPGAGPRAPVGATAQSLPPAPSRADLPPPLTPVPAPAQPSAPAPDGTIPPPPAGVAASLAPRSGPAPEAPATGRFSRFGLGGKTRSEPAAKAAAPKPETATRTEAEKERLTVFGARRQEAEIGGKPRFLGLILTAILILVMAAVAAWAAFGTNSFNRVFGLGEAPSVVSGPGSPDDPAAVETAAPQAAAAPEPSGLASPETPAADPAPVPAFEPEPLPATVSPVAPGSVPTGEMLLSGVTSLLPDPDLLRALAAPTPAEAVAETSGAVLSPAAAERFYAATGVWLRAPRLSDEPQPATLGTVARLITDERPGFGQTPDIARSAPDAVLAARVDPPPADMRFERDARGFLLATPEGTVTPYGLVIYAGSPSIVPPTRPGTPPVLDPPEEAIAAAPPAAEPSEVAQATARPEVAPTAPAPEAETAAIVVDATERLASEALAVLDAAPARPDARISTAGVLDAPAIDLNGLRPALRPAGQVPEALLPEVELASFEGPRPPLRPEGLAPVPEVAPEETAAEEAPPSAVVEDALAGILAGAADPLATATPQAVARATRPDSRPQNFDRVVQQARARQSQQSAQAAAPAQQQARASEPEEVSNAAAQPTGPVPQTVASAATLENAINLRQINLIGVYGRPSDRRALVRLANGRYVRVAVGDRLDGGQVAAINDTTLNYVKSGRTLTLEIPSG